MPNYTPPAPEKPNPPSWMSKGGKAIFADMVNDLMAAGVPIKRVDKHAIAMASTCLDEVQRWSKIGDESTGSEMKMQCAQVVARNQRDAQEWLAVIGASPKSRAQMGLRQQEAKKKPGAVAQILQIKRQVSGS
jgi:hypothetical protein